MSASPRLGTVAGGDQETWCVDLRAEGVGFEPTRQLTPPTRFPGVRTRPDYAIPP